MCRMCIVEVDTGRGPALQPSCMIECSRGMKVDTDIDRGQEGAGRRPRVPAHQPPARLPGLRQGRRVPAAGPDDGLRAGREPLRRGEAPLREADPDQRPRVARPRALHPVRPLHPLRQGRRRRPADPLHRPGQRDRGQHLPRRAVLLVLQRQHRADLPGRRADRQALPLQGPPVGPRAGQSRPARRARSAAASRSSRSRDEVLRYQGVDIDPVNWGWLCDKGRFGFEAVDSDGPAGRAAGARRATTLVAAAWTDALDGGGRRHRERARRRRARRRSPCIGGARLTNEDAYAWAKLAKGVIGTDNVDAQLGDGLPAELVLGLPRATIDEVCAAGGTVVLLGARPQGGAAGPVPAAAPRGGRSDGARIVEVSPHGDRAHALRVASLRPGPASRLRLVRALLGTARRRTEPAASTPTRSPRPRAARRPARSPSSSAGRRWPSRRRRRRRRRRAARRWPDARFLPVLRRGNVHGALDMGLAPGLLPGRVALDAGRDAVRGGAGRRCPPSAGSTPAASSRRPPTAARRAGAARRRPAADFPDRDLADAGARRRAARSSPSTSSSTPSSAAGRRRAAGGRLRRERGHHHQPRGPGQPPEPEGHRRRAPPGPTGSSPPSSPTASAPTSASSRSRSIRAEIAAVSPGVRRHRRGAAGARPARRRRRAAARPRREPPSRAREGRLEPSPTRPRARRTLDRGYALPACAVGPQALRPPARVTSTHVAVARRPRAGGAVLPPATPPTSTASAWPPAPRCASTSAHGLAHARRRRRRRRCPRSVAVGRAQPAGRRRRRAHRRTPAVTDVRRRDRRRADCMFADDPLLIGPIDGWAVVG